MCLMDTDSADHHHDCAFPRVFGMQLSHSLVTIILPHSLVQLSYGWKLSDDMELGRSLWFGGDHLDASFFYWTLLMNTKLLHQNARHTVEEIILHQQSTNQKNHAQYSCTHFVRPPP